MPRSHRYAIELTKIRNPATGQPSRSVAGVAKSMRHFRRIVMRDFDRTTMVCTSQFLSPP